MSKKVEVLKSKVLFDQAEKVEVSNVEIAVSGKTEVKITVFPDGEKMTGYIRNSRGRVILQAPLKKLDKVLAEPMGDHRERENSKQAIYAFKNMQDLLTTLDQVVS